MPLAPNPVGRSAAVAASVSQSSLPNRATAAASAAAAAASAAAASAAAALFRVRVASTPPLPVVNSAPSSSSTGTASFSTAHRTVTVANAARTQGDVCTSGGTIVASGSFSAAAADETSKISRPNNGGGGNRDVGVETPRKRRRRNGWRDTASGSSGANEACFRCVSVASAVALLEDTVLAESLALLDSVDIGYCAAVCVSWRRVADGGMLWQLATPRLGLANRVVQRLELSRRRSRGIVSQGMLLGARREAAALRTVDLRSANAGVDDGLLPSVVREIALLQSLGSATPPPNLVRFLGVELYDQSVHVATEFVASSFAIWFSEPRAHVRLLRSQIRERFSQMFRGLAFLHGRGVFHRNLVPSNVLFDPDTGIVKISDLAHGRPIDVPLRPYSPEDPKLRNQSTREARRLWYRAPELLLRQETYGPGVDMWSAGCLLAEAANGEALFPSENEIDHLFRIFRFVGTPCPKRWPEALGTPAFQPSFPVYEPVDLRLAARAARTTRSAEDCSSDARTELRKSLKTSRADLIDVVLRCGAVLLLEGAELLERLLWLDPAQRCTAAECAADQGQMSAFLRRGRVSRAIRGSATGVSQGTGDQVKADAKAGEQQLDKPASTPWPPLWQEMVRLEATAHARPFALHAGNASASSFAGGLPAAPWEFSWRAHAHIEEGGGHVRASVVNFLVSLADRLSVGLHTVHLAVAFFDNVWNMPPPRDLCGFDLEPEFLATLCLKLADVFDEHSQEYFQRERTQAYVTQVERRWGAEEIVAGEKQLAQRLGFELHRPTALWFLRSCLEVVGAEELHRAPGVAAMARMILELALLDNAMQAFPASLRAQAALLLAVYVVRSGSGGSGGGCSDSACLQPVWHRVRRATCGANSRGLAVACVGRLVHVLSTLRSQWAARGLRAVEQRHRAASRRPMPVGIVPAWLADELLPLED
eukprot:TRINITY_DN27798_c0_g1_i1.p1 TRINITY_DN27798_c0_g1~~TRINITY_DN27798_c0_g1_i1.p1  ORF type:complete len:937 (+),score=152.04 TRINITY_DN27798_c0_g1_i1:141-2951(+)